MTAYRYANIKKYLHGMAFKGGSHMPCGQGLLARHASRFGPHTSSKRAAGRNPVSSNSWNRCFLRMATETILVTSDNVEALRRRRMARYGPGHAKARHFAFLFNR
jgi:hypothetical protein